MDNLKNKEEIYTELYNHYILPAAKVYRNQQSDLAFNLYKEGIEFALKNISKSNKLRTLLSIDGYGGITVDVGIYITNFVFTGS